MARRAKVSRDEVVQAALRLIDESGLSALSMRALGQSLGVEAMTLYNYVGNKEQLLLSVKELILSEVPALSGERGWREDLRDFALATYRALSAHPRALVLFVAGAPTGRSRAAFFDFAQRSLEGAIPQDLDRYYAASALDHFVFGQAVMQSVSAMSKNGEELSRRGTFHEVSRSDFALVADGPQGYALEVEFELGLDALLEGFERRKPF